MSPVKCKTAIYILAAVSAVFASVSVAAPPPEKIVGVYRLLFSYGLDGTNELTLDAHIRDNELNPAVDGVVVFDYCSYKGIPRYDTTQPDEAPSSACADGSGKWVRVSTPIPVSNGHALLNFGEVQVVNVIGFRYKYSRGSEIANSLFGPVDWIR